MSATVHISHCPRELPPYVRIGDTPDIFEQVRDPGVKLIIWQRELPAHIARAVQFLARTDAFHAASNEISNRLQSDMVVSFSPSNIQMAASLLKNPAQLFRRGVSASPSAPNLQKIETSFNRRCQGAAFLAEDAAFLTGLYHRYISGVNRLRINPFFQKSLEPTGRLRVHKDGRKGDSKWRMITTHFGPETVWTPEDNVDRSTFRKRNSEWDVIDEARVYGFGLGSVGLMKGGCDGISHSGPVLPVRKKRMGMLLLPEMA